MLARLNQIDGVESSFTDTDSTLIQVSLRPSADPAKVARQAQWILTERVGDRVPVRLGREAAAAALPGKEWWDNSRITESAAAPMAPTTRPASGAMARLLLVGLAIGLGLLGWWQRRRLAASLLPLIGMAPRPGTAP